MSPIRYDSRESYHKPIWKQDPQTRLFKNFGNGVLGLRYPLQSFYDILKLKYEFVALSSHLI